MKFHRMLLVALAAVSLAAVAFASKQNSFPDIPVTSTLNVAGDLVPDPGTNYRIEGDNYGLYVNGVGSVSSILQGGLNSATRDWVLDTSTSTTRTVLIDLRAPVPNSGAVQIFAWQLVPTRIIVKCHETVSGSFLAIGLNQTVSCPAFVRFSYGGTDYRLVMSSGPGAVTADYPETNNALVTCAAANASNVCNDWKLQPITQADGSVKNVARLQKAARGGGWTNQGDFYMTFNFEVTNP